MSVLKCVVHLDGQTSYTKLKTLSETNITRLKEAKKKRLDLGGNHNNQQVANLPEDLNKENLGVHLEPCYKRY